MKLLRSHPFFSAVMVLALIVVAAEIGLMYSGRKQEKELENQLQSRLDEIERLQRQKPAPNQDNLQAARDDFVQNAVVLSTMLRSLNVGGPDELEYFQGEPAKSTDAYFDIAQFVDRMQQAATEAGVSLDADERFGFSAYANVGPETGLIRPVYRQRRIVEYLLRALFSARPRALISVQREEPAPVTTATEPAAAPASRNARPSPAVGANANGSAPAGGGDFFVIDPQVSARTPDYVDTMPFRLTFSGQTAALRGFMNALAAPEIPLVVRSVEVEPGSAEGATSPSTGSPRSGPPASLFGRPSTAAPAEDAGASIPIVSENDSRFIVTVELFEVKIRAPDLSGETEAQP
ncbi:MAG: hypothetical protein ACREIA_18045 [Opitutaceae bacterium]